MPHALFHGLTGKFILSIPGEDNDLRLQCLLPNLPDHADSVQKRHFDIGDDQIRLFPPGGLISFLPVSRCSDQLNSIFFPGNQLFHSFPLQLLIVHQKQSVHKGPSFSSCRPVFLKLSIPVSLKFCSLPFFPSGLLLLQRAAEGYSVPIRTAFCFLYCFPRKA